MTFYWYLVVGGGASGCVVAARLVETGKSVLLLGKGKLKFFVGRSLRPLTYRTDKLVLYMFIGLHWLFDPDSRENKLSPCDSFKEDQLFMLSSSSWCFLTCSPLLYGWHTFSYKSRRVPARKNEGNNFFYNMYLESPARKNTTPSPLLC